jgi:hypothetical protein
MPALLRNNFYMFQWISGLSPITQMAQASAADFDAATMGPVLAAIIGFVAVMILVVLILAALIIIAKWHVFKKVGMPGWNALVPFYNTVRELEYTNLPMWWIFLLIIPFVNIVFAIILARRIAGAFGKGGWFTVGLVLLPFIFYPILGFGSAKYKNHYPEAKPMSDATKYALIAAFAFMLLFMRGGSSSTSKFHMPLHTYGESGYAADEMYVYYFDQLVPDADAKTFMTVEDPSGSYDAKDKSHYYAGGAIVPATEAGVTVEQ